MKSDTTVQYDFMSENYEAAIEFIEKLRLTNPRWSIYSAFPDTKDKQWSRNWLFRGQGNAEWPLTPKAWRNDETITDIRNHLTLDREKIAIHVRNYKSNVSDNVELLTNVIFNAWVEYTIVNEFSSMASGLAFKMSEPKKDKSSIASSSFWKMYLNELTKAHEENQPNADYFDIWKTQDVILAQHHGLPTRLLDWTHNPLVAAYFAAWQSLKQKDSTRIAVYAYNPIWNENLPLIQTVSLPYSESTYVHAQKGILTLFLNGDKYYLQHGKYPSLESTLDNRGYTTNPFIKPTMFTLPVSQVPELLRLLWLENVTHGHLMPTLDNVAEALKVKWAVRNRQLGTD